MQFIIADDDSDDIELFAEALKAIHPAAGLITANTGKQLLSLLSDCRPSAIFLDINMPEMSGWECLRWLKSKAAFNHIPVIIYTTSSSKRDIDTAVSMGAYRLLTKPDRIQDLAKMLSDIITEVKRRNTTN